MTGRRARHPKDQREPRVVKDGKLWRIRSYEAGRQVLRARHQTTQAGFTAEYIPQAGMENRPILISDGPRHDEQRSKVGRFFAPKVVDERHRSQIIASAKRLLDGAGREFSLDELALQFTVEVTAEIVGLTHEVKNDTQARYDRRITAMAKRLVSFFEQPPFDMSRDGLGRRRRDWLKAARKGLWPIATFWSLDVRPAVKQRRREPAGDVISHLIEEGYSNVNILIEAITYGTAGMVTTREFIAMAAWHLLTTPELAERYTSAEEDDRLALLAEMLRVETVVGHLYRRTTDSITVTDGDDELTIPAGDLVDVDIRAANIDPQAIDDPEAFCPYRPLPKGSRSTMLSFGDGAHRCPGEPLALLEADVFLTRLMARQPRLVKAPDIGWDDLVTGYELRGMRVAQNFSP